MDDRAKYTKGPKSHALGSAPGEGATELDAPFDLRVTLGDMALEDAFRVTLPASFARLNIEELLERIFGGEGPSRPPDQVTLDLRKNPDAPEMYDALVEVFRGRYSGRNTLRTFVNHGPEMEPTDAVLPHLRARAPSPRDGAAGAVLDVVIEQRYTPLDYAVAKGHAESVAELLKWLRAHTLLYYLDAHRFKLEVDPKSQLDRRLLPIARYLRDRGLVAPSTKTEAFAITDEGRQALAGMIAETESHIDRYDIFGDVLYDAESAAVSFDTGRGEDLRVTVYEAEGLDPLRAVFLLALNDAVLDNLPYDWREAVHQQAFYAELLTPAVDHPSLDEDQVETIIESGFAYVEEGEEQSRRLASQRQLLSRAKKR